MGRGTCDGTVFQGSLCLIVKRMVVALASIAVRSLGKKTKVATFVPEETPLATFVFAHASKVSFAWKTVLISTDRAKLF